MHSPSGLPGARSSRTGIRLVLKKNMADSDEEEVGRRSNRSGSSSSHRARAKRDGHPPRPRSRSRERAASERSRGVLGGIRSPTDFSAAEKEQHGDGARGAPTGGDSVGAAAPRGGPAGAAQVHGEALGHGAEAAVEPSVKARDNFAMSPPPHQPPSNGLGLYDVDLSLIPTDWLRSQKLLGRYVVKFVMSCRALGSCNSFVLFSDWWEPVVRGS